MDAADRSAAFGGAPAQARPSAPHTDEAGAGRGLAPRCSAFPIGQAALRDRSGVAMDAGTARSSIQAGTDRRDGRWSPQCFQRSVSVERPQARDAVGGSMHSTSARPAWAGDARSPATGGAPRTRISRPCCATRSGCARRHRLGPGGRGWSPGTTDHLASPTGRTAPPC